ncbi:MAG: helix-turn-helix transcriptional regulator [Clostridia bacterium]|nr:helix-turn-helix transcriptional regulator [Clostridia bacterium]MBQ5612119.1 helix-turn-helix transcriptional regulator [Clostridia bacterium]
MYREKLLRMTAVTEALPKGIDLQFHLSGAALRGPSTPTERNEADVCSIVYLTGGSAQLLMGQDAFSVRAGDSLLLPIGSSYRLLGEQKEGVELLWVSASGELLRQLIRTHGLEGAVHFPSLDLSEPLGRLRFYAEHPHEDAARACVALLEELLYRMAEAHYATEKQPLSPVEQILRYIEEHETEAIRLEQLAEAAGKSPSQAERLFRKEMGQPIYRYVLSRKLELACRLLLESGMSVREIASYLSFEDEFYFSGLFRRKIGLSPSQYRKTGGKKPEPKPAPRRRRDDDIVLL